MEKKINTSDNSFLELNLKNFVSSIFEYKYLFVLSIGVSVAIAFVYAKLTTPTYEVSSSMLIDASGNNRVMSAESQYLEGGVQLMEMETNLFNEIGIMKSFSLVRRTLEDLNFNISYFAGDWKKNKEYYGYFPFKVILTEKAVQSLDLSFDIKILSKERFALTIESKKFIVSNPVTKSNRKIEKDFFYSEEFSFGELIQHDYFNLLLELPEYNVVADEFEGLELSFIVHDYDDLANGYISSLNVENIDIQASILQIGLSGTMVNKEIDFLAKLMENYMDDKLMVRDKIGSTKEAFIRKQLHSISDSLARAEMNLEAFKRNKQALNLTATASNAMQQSQILQSEIAKIEFDIKNYNSVIEYLKDSSNARKMVAPSAVGIDDQMLNASLMELQRLYSEKVKKQFFVTRNNQELGNLNSQITKTTELLLENLKSLVQSSELALEAANSQLSNFMGRISALPTREIQLLNIQRRKALYENLFNYLSQELAKTGIARAESVSNTRILEQPRMVGDGPVSPKTKLMLVLAVIIGLIVPLGWIVLVSSFDDTIQNLGQIEEHTNLQVVASIAHFSGSKKHLSPSDISQWRVEESFRDLTANLQYLLHERESQSRVIGVTSKMPDEGKTFCAINLAIKLAESGRNTLIIDSDLRNPSLVNEVDDIKGNGLSNYLEGKVKSIDSITYTHEKLNNLKYIPTEVADDNIQELLSGIKMQSLVQDLKDKYDYIIVDAPAVGLVSDYLLVSNIIDINLFVIRRKVSKVSFLYEFEKLSSYRNMQNSYIVFNDAIGKEYKYGYSKEYGKAKSSIAVSKSFTI